MKYTAILFSLETLTVQFFPLITFQVRNFTASIKEIAILVKALCQQALEFEKYQGIFTTGAAINEAIMRLNMNTVVLAKIEEDLPDETSSRKRLEKNRILQSKSFRLASKNGVHSF